MQLSTFAAESHVDRSIHGPCDFVQTNIVGTFHLLEAVRGYGGAYPGRHKTHTIPGKFLSYMQAGLPVLATINAGNDLADLIQTEGVGRVCIDHSIDTLQSLAEALVQEIAGDVHMSTRCRALSAKLFSPEAAVKQITAALRNEILL